MGKAVDKASLGAPLAGGLLLAAVAVAVYWGVAWSLTLLPGEPLALGLRPLWVGLALVAYVVFAYDYVALFATYRDAYPGVRHRAALLAGAQVGTLTFKVLMMVIWFALSQALPLIGLMLLFASTQLLKVAEFSVADAEQMPAPVRGPARMLRALVAAPNRLLAPLTRGGVRPLDRDIAGGLTPRGLFERARRIPMSTIHDMAAFVPFYREISIVEFGVGVLLGNLLVSGLVLVWPGRTVAVLRHPVAAVLGCAGFLALVGVCGARFVDVVRELLERS